MTQTQDLCPSTDNGNHRYFIFKVVEVFEPLDQTAFGMLVGKIPEHIYEKVEYAVSGCNCGSSIKTKVKQQ
jgi:hypothetical protein